MSDARTVLVVEDNEQNLELVEYLLEEAGIEVSSAMDADAARQKLSESRPDLVLLDMHLPGTSGLTLVEEIRADARTRDITVVALTAHAMRGDRERFLAGGCDGYIPKPINVAGFVSEVQKFLADGTD